MDENQDENLVKCAKWYKISLIAGIFVLITNTLYTIFYFVLWVKINNGLGGGHYPIEIELALYVTLLIFAVFRFIWLQYLTKMRKSNPVPSLTVFNVIQVIVVCGIGILSIYGILYSIDEILYPILIPDHFLLHVLRDAYEETIQIGPYTLMGLEIIAWLFFYAYIKRKIKDDQHNSSKKIRTGIILYVITLGIPMIWAWFAANFSPFDVFDFTGIMFNTAIMFIIFSNYIIGLYFQFKMVGGIIHESER